MIEAAPVLVPIDEFIDAADKGAVIVDGVRAIGPSAFLGRNGPRRCSSERCNRKFVAGRSTAASRGKG